VDDGLLQHHDPWNHPLLMMDDDDDHDDVGEYYHYTLGVAGLGHSDPTATAMTSSVKRVSLDATETFMMMDTDAVENSIHPNDCVVGQDDHDFAFMEGLEDDPILTLSTTGKDVASLVPDVATSLQSHHTSSYLPLSFLSSDDDDPWTEAATEAAFQMTSGDHDFMVLELDHSYVKLHDYEKTVGTESTTSSYSSSSTSFLCTTTNDADQTDAEPLTSPTSFSSQFQERRQLLAESMRASQLSRQCLSLKEHIKLRANLAQVLKDIETSTATVQLHCLQLTTTEASSSVGDDVTDDYTNEISTDTNSSSELTFLESVSFPVESSDVVAGELPASDPKQSTIQSEK
jgi:hypothetical protein